MSNLKYTRQRMLEKSGKSAFGEALIAPLIPTAAWLFAYNINTEIVDVTTATGGTVTQDAGRAVLQTSAAAGGLAKINTKRSLRYTPGIGGAARFTVVFDTPAAGAVQLIGIGNGTDALAYGYNGLDFGTLRRRGGVDVWDISDQWSERLHTTLGKRINTSLGNVLQIYYQWLGYGGLMYFAEEPSTGDTALVHMIKYANTSTDVSVLNPTLPIFASVENASNDTNITLRTSSAVAGFHGWPMSAEHHPMNLHRTHYTSLAVTTEAAVLTISNKVSYAGVSNRVGSQPVSLSVTTDGNKSVRIRGVLDTTLGGTPSWTDYHTTNSPVEYDEAGTTLAGGDEIFTLGLSKSDSIIIDLKQYTNPLLPGQTLTVSAQSSASNTVDVALSWDDLF